MAIRPHSVWLNYSYKEQMSSCIKAKVARDAVIGFSMTDFPIKSAKAAKKAATKRVAPKAAKPPNTTPKSKGRKAAKPRLLSGANWHILPPIFDHCLPALCVRLFVL
jgi:hypothetical protein